MNTNLPAANPNTANSRSAAPGALPLFTPILTALIADLRLPATIFRSYTRMYAAAWSFAYQRTAELDFETQLIPLLGVSRSQARQHLRLLRGAGLIAWTSDGSQRYVIHFPSAADSVVGVVNIINPISLNNQQQHTLSEKKDPAAPVEKAPPDPNTSSALLYLRRAGVWPNVAQNLAQKIAANESAVSAANSSVVSEAGGAGRNDDLPGLGDVLGWIAYCIADREKNRISQPAAVLAANLNAGRRCPESYRAPRICANCYGAEGYCDCEDEPEYGYPPEFLQCALRGRSSYISAYVDRWGVCLYCHCVPCRCGRVESD